MAVPMHAGIRRQDRPRHVGETAGEKRSRQFDDVMLGFEPGDIVRFLFTPDFAEADEGMHLVFIASHGLGHRGDQRDIRIGRDLEQMVLPAQPPQQPIQDRKPFRVTVQNGRLRKFDEFGGDGESALWVFERQPFGGRREQFGGIALDDPGHVGWLDLIQRQRSRRFAPAFEVGFAVEGDEVHSFTLLATYSSSS